MATTSQTPRICCSRRQSLRNGQCLASMITHCTASSLARMVAYILILVMQQRSCVMRIIRSLSTDTDIQWSLLRDFSAPVVNPESTLTSSPWVGWCFVVNSMAVTSKYWDITSATTGRLRRIHLGRCGSRIMIMGRVRAELTSSWNMATSAISMK